jgi:BirA family biotin operon repressor/biotin-[acetyl-CoA-carboxylase] ligase
MYDLPALEAELAGSVFAGKLHFTPVTGSTNNDAMAAGRNAAPHGSVWFADEQSAGRGRGGHAWHSAAGAGLYVSVLLRLRISSDRLLLLPLAAGLAAVDAIRAVAGLAVDLRWPNDLLIGPKKTGGILVEAQSESGAHAFAVVGIGINVHQRSFDPELATPGTSLDVAAGGRTSRQALLVTLLKSMESEICALQSHGAAEAIRSRLQAGSTWIRGRRVKVHGSQACTGITDGLDERGFLRVRTASGLVTVQSGGIREPEID